MDGGTSRSWINWVDVAGAASLITRADRVLVIGCSGGGKSTLSTDLCRRFDLPYISMDRDIFWLPGWNRRPKAEERVLMAGFVTKRRWLIDGNAPSSFDLRLPRTDLVLWVRMPRALCLWGAISRWLRWRGRIRPEMAPGCPERIDGEFLRYIWTFEKKMTPRIVAGLAEHGPDVPACQLRSRREMKQFLALLDAAP